MGTEIEPVKGQTGILWIISVAALILLFFCCFWKIWGLSTKN